MRSIVIGAVVALAIAGGAYLWLDNKGGTSHGEDAAVDKHSLVVELAAPVKTKLEKTSTGNPIGYNPKMVSVTVTLRFADEAALGKVRAEIRQLRRAYSNAIGTYLSNSEAAEDVDAAVRSQVATATEKMLGAGVVVGFDVEGQFDEFKAK